MDFMKATESERYSLLSNFTKPKQEHTCSWETIYQDEDGNFIPCDNSASHLLYQLRDDHWYCDFHAECHSSEEKLCAELGREEQEYAAQEKLAAGN